MNFSQAHSGTKVRYVNRACFLRGHQNSHKNGRNSYELFVLPLSLVWFAGATPDCISELRGENPGAFPKAGPIFQQRLSLPENAQTLVGIAFRAAGESVTNFPAAPKFARKCFQQGISDSHSLLEFSDVRRLNRSRKKAIKNCNVNFPGQPLGWVSRAFFNGRGFPLYF